MKTNMVSPSKIFDPNIYLLKRSPKPLVKLFSFTIFHLNNTNNSPVVNGGSSYGLWLYPACPNISQPHLDPCSGKSDRFGTVSPGPRPYFLQTFTHRIHGAGIYTNIKGVILMGSMLPYISPHHGSYGLGHRRSFPPKNPPGGGAPRLRRARLRPGGVLRGIHRGGRTKNGGGFRGGGFRRKNIRHLMILEDL